MRNEHYEFKLSKLPYNNDALVPFIDEKTMELHHDFHLKAYIDNLNKALSNLPQYSKWSLEKLIFYSDSIPVDVQTTIKNNAGGVYNHNFYFNNLSKDGMKIPTGKLGEKINNDFGDFENFKTAFKQSALNVFGSGWTWLVSDKFGELIIINTKNQDTTLPLNLIPLITIDVWEHAYYLKHNNRRPDYIEDWFSVVDFKNAVAAYDRLLK